MNKEPKMLKMSERARNELAERFASVAKVPLHIGYRFASAYDAGLVMARSSDAAIVSNLGSRDYVKGFREYFKEMAA